MVYEFEALGAMLPGLGSETVKQYIPGVMKYPVKRRHFGFAQRFSIDIGEIISDNDFVTREALSFQQYITCLRDLMESLAETEITGATSPLLTVLESAWRKHRKNPERMLDDFVCFADLLQPENMGGSSSLRTELYTFFSRNSDAICRKLPLPQSLQYVDMCSSADFPAAMKCLLASLSSNKRRTLEEKCGKIRLFMTDEPSKKVRQYVLSRPSNSGTTARLGNQEMVPFRHHNHRHPGNSLVISNRDSRGLVNHHGRAGRLLSAEECLARNIHMVDLAERGGEVVLPTGGRRHRRHGRLFGHNDDWFDD